ncbi:hypothetical protein ACOSQ4_008498 [Xanthoceras sorbifolium]
MQVPREMALILYSTLEVSWRSPFAICQDSEMIVEEIRRAWFSEVSYLPCRGCNRITSVLELLSSLLAFLLKFYLMLQGNFNSQESSTSYKSVKLFSEKASIITTTTTRQFSSNHHYTKRRFFRYGFNDVN